MAGRRWRETTVGALCDEGALHTQTGPFGSQLHSFDYVSSGIPVVPTEGIGRRRFLTDGIPEISEETAARLSRHRLRAGDILFARRGVQATGLSAIVTPLQEGWICGTGALLLRVTGTETDPEFLSFLLSSDESFEWLRQHAVGAVMPNLNEGVIRRLPLALPPLAEQKAIAVVLGALDDKIELNRRMNATLEAMARALFQSWFVDFDPVRAKLDGRNPDGLDKATAALFPAAFQDSPLGPIPRGWKVLPLKDVTSKIGSGATPRGGSAVYVDEGVALIRSQNVYDHDFRWGGLARLSESSAAELDNVEVRVDDVLFNITGDSILRTCVVEPSVLPARVNQHVAIIRAKPPVSSRYVHLYMVQPRIKEFLLGLNAGATRPAVTKGHLESVLVLHPSPEILAAFDVATAPMFRQIDTNRIQSRTLATLRDTLLPKLLSGELAVPPALGKVNS